MRKEVFDIFISYRNDLLGKSIGRAIKDILESQHYSVYYNPDEQTEDSFPDELRNAVLNCKDFVLIMTQACLNRLLENLPTDWVRNEILTAHDNHKHIIPLLIDGVKLPDDEIQWPEPVRFLHFVNYVPFPNDPDRIAVSPINLMKKKHVLLSRPEKGEIYRDVYNSNREYDVNENYQRVLKSAETGDVNSLYELSLNYYYGFANEEGCSKRDFERAYECFKKLSETDNPYKAFSISMIGHMYYASTIPREGQSYEQALKLAEIAAETILGEAYHVAYMKSIGSGCEFNFGDTVAYYENIISSCGNAGTIYNLAQFYLDYGEYTKAADLLRPLSMTYPLAAIQLGKIYKRGLLTNPPKPDYLWASFYFQQAIESGQCGAEVYYEMGRLYFNPTGGFPKSFQRAEYYFTQAADRGHIDAQYILGYMYENGHVGRNIEKAIHYHEMAAKQGNIDSCASLALLYQQPEHLNYQRAFNYAKFAANSGMSMAEFYYANLLFFGRGCQADMNEAYKYYKRSFEHGFVQSKLMMDKIDKILHGK